ncbi:methyltransferase domain-containing protein [Saccharibacillus sp. CPCC 101409]|uniref:MerR family transcriptional regulator n=1 Tax=Saccharibacillus sp. CPCC 101409 TaxID=3058041 RepID=UPI002672EA8E|nr:methyltransferase domain-containing protein [Saccharibacillus sp. CPCC 101409]MDO3411395.1 methyltransferase domain-containing protein [Saccharibacillus sp. CPCC 101409]
MPSEEAGGMRIKELAEKLGLSARSIRFYESKGLLPPSRRLENGYRVFDAGDERKLKRIAALREIGLTVEEIGALPDRGDSAAAEAAVRSALERRRSMLFAQMTQIGRDIRTLDRMLERSGDSAEESVPAFADREEAWFGMAAQLKHIRELHAGWTDVWDFDARAAEHDSRVLGAEGSPEHPHYAAALDAVCAITRPAAGERGLDIGAGTGNLAGRLSESGADMAAVDQSAAMLEICRAKFPALDARPGNFLYLPFESGSFDFAVSSYAFHHLSGEQKPLALREIRRVLKPGGRFCIADTMFEHEGQRQLAVAELERRARSGGADGAAAAAELRRIREVHESNLDELLELIASQGWRAGFVPVAGAVYLVHTGDAEEAPRRAGVNGPAE